MYKTDTNLCKKCYGDDCATCYKGSGYYERAEEVATLRNTDKNFNKDAINPETARTNLYDEMSKLLTNYEEETKDSMKALYEGYFYDFLVKLQRNWDFI